MTKHEDTDAGELVDTARADLLRQAFGAAIAEIFNHLGDCPARKFAIQELVTAEQRVRERLARRILN
jgi:hypothetical protein